MRSSIVAHPFLFALFQVLFLYTHNIGELSISVIYAPLALILAAAFIFWAIVGLMLRDGAKAGLIVSLFLTLFFSFGHAYNTVMGGSLVIPLCILWPAVFFAGAYFSVRSSANMRNLTGVLNAVAAVLVAISLFNIGSFELGERGAGDGFDPVGSPEPGAGRAHKLGELPNIFFIVLDGYGRADVLKEFYGLDNTDFIEYLEGKGFYVADSSVANYSQTGLAFASILNMEYLDEFARQVGVDSINRQPLYTASKKSILFDFLRSRGYRVAAFSSGRPETELDDAELYLSPGESPNTFKNELINTTPIPLIISALSTPETMDNFEQHRKRLLFIMDGIAELTVQKSPVFVFAHIESPHPPFVFGADGERVSYETRFNDHDADWLIRKGRLTISQYLKAYSDQVVFLNKRMKTVVDELLKRSKRPPVIVLMGDHGPRSMLVWGSPERTYFPESMTNLNALYLPGGGDHDLYEGISPVNTFRVVLNRYFGTDLDLLEDKSYFSTAKHLYKFIDVTDKVRMPDRLLMHIKLGDSFAMEGSFRKAAGHYEDALALSPDDALLHYSLGAALLNISDYEQALLHFSESVRLAPDYEPARRNMDKLKKIIEEGGAQALPAG